MKIRNAIAVLVLSCAFAQSQALAQAEAPPPARTYMATPDGKGDPNTITCRPPQKLVNSRMMGPEVCKTNGVWAQYAKDGMEVAADGIHDVPSEKFRTLNPRVCHPVNMGGGGTGGAFSTNFSQVCD
jgi:hypothetical protein